MRCVGTSATVAGKGTREARHAEVAEIASRLFGTDVRAEQVIGETLRPAIDRRRPAQTNSERAQPATGLSRRTGPPALPNSSHLIAAWTEAGFGVRRDGQNRLERKPPATLTKAARRALRGDGASQRRPVPSASAAGSPGRIQDRGPRDGPASLRFASTSSSAGATPSTARWNGPRPFILRWKVRSTCPAAATAASSPSPSVASAASPISLSTAPHRPRSLDPRRAERRGAEEEQTGAPASSSPTLTSSGRRPLRGSAAGGLARAPKRRRSRVKSANRKLLPVHVTPTPGGRSRLGGDGTLPVWFAPAPFRFCLPAG